MDDKSLRAIASPEGIKNLNKILWKKKKSLYLSKYSLPLSKQNLWNDLQNYSFGSLDFAIPCRSPDFQRKQKIRLFLYCQTIFLS